MKRGQHKCAACDNVCPREYPFCYPCWLEVPDDLRKTIKAELAKADADGGALYYAVQAAAVNLRKVEVTPAVEFWERLWEAAGCPELEVVGGKVPAGVSV